MQKKSIYKCNSNDKAITVGGEVGLWPPQDGLWRAFQMV